MYLSEFALIVLVADNDPRPKFGRHPKPGKTEVAQVAAVIWDDENQPFSNRHLIKAWPVGWDTRHLTGQARRVSDGGSTLGRARDLHWNFRQDQQFATVFGDWWL